MVKIIPLVIKKGIGFDYLLIDSWFTCIKQVKYIIIRLIGCRLLGGKKMVKHAKWLVFYYCQLKYIHGRIAVSWTW